MDQNFSFLKNIPNVEYNSLQIYLNKKGNFVIESFSQFCDRVHYVWKN